MTNRQFEKFLKETMKNCGSKYIDISEDLTKPHTFSIEFEEKMDKLINTESKFYFPLVKTPFRKRLTTSLSVALGVVITLSSIVPVRAGLDTFVMESYDDHVEIYFDSEKFGIKCLDYMYKFSEIPEGFELQHFKFSENHISLEYEKGKESISLDQFIDTSLGVDNEHTDITYIDVFGNQGILFQNNNTDFNESILIWEDEGQYVILTVCLKELSIYDVLELMVKTEYKIYI